MSSIGELRVGPKTRDDFPEPASFTTWRGDADLPLVLAFAGAWLNRNTGPNLLGTWLAYA